MEISDYVPPPPRPSPPGPPHGDRTKLIISALFVLTFLVTFAVANRHELAATIFHRTDKPAITATRPLAHEPMQQRTEAAKVQLPSAQTQTTVMPPSVFQ